MSVPTKSQTAVGSLVAALALLTTMWGCGGGESSSPEALIPTPGDVLVMTVDREGTPVYEAQYRWTEMPEAESGSGEDHEPTVFALLEEETYHDPDFQSIAPPKDPVTREELTTFLRDHWDEYCAGTDDRGWNLEDFMRFLHGQGICWEDFFDLWEDHHAAGGTVPELVGQLTDFPARISRDEDPFWWIPLFFGPSGVPGADLLVRYRGPDKFADNLVATPGSFWVIDPLSNTPLRRSTYSTSILTADQRDRDAYGGGTQRQTASYVVRWKGNLLRHSSVIKFSAACRYNAGCRNFDGHYILDMGVDVQAYHAPGFPLVMPRCGASVSDLRDAGPVVANPKGYLVVHVGFLWLWQHFNTYLRFPFRGTHGISGAEHGKADVDSF